jgi:hypothetical protein
MTLGSKAQIVNNGTYRALPRAGTVFNWTSGPVRPTFTNRGRFVKAAELSEPLHVGDVHFVNHGTIEVQSFAGVLNFNGPATFEAGSRFEGRATVRVSHDATFRGEFFSGMVITSGVLELAAGRFTGMEATMTGSVLWTGGTLADRWTNAGRLAVFTEFGRPTKTIDGSFINARDMVWLGVSSDTLLFGTSTVFENRGTFRILSPLGAGQVKEIRRASGGAPQLRNLGSFVHEGPRTTSLFVPFENLGRVEVQAGTLRFRDTLTQQGTILGGRTATLVVLDGTENFGTIEGFGSIQGMLINHGHLAPGFSPGTLQLAGGYTHAVDGVLDIDLQDAATFDRLVIAGVASLLGGELALHCFAGCGLHVGDSFTFLEADDLTGTFSNMSLHGFGPGWRFDVSYDYDADMVRLAVLQVGAPGPQPVPEPGTLALTLIGLALGVTARWRCTRSRTIYGCQATRSYGAGPFHVPRLWRQDGGLNVLPDLDSTQ